MSMKITPPQEWMEVVSEEENSKLPGCSQGGSGANTSRSMQVLSKTWT